LPSSTRTSKPAAVAVDDGWTSTGYERDPAKIDTGLQNNTWDFLFIEHTPQRPALSDAEIIQAIAVLGYQIRNYDEYATLFEDSRQDAVRFVTGGRPWSQARWEVKVGDFQTSGTNHVSERWQELPLLTEGMNAITRRVIANTNELLRRIGRNESADTQELGTLQEPPGRLLYRARLRAGIPSTIVDLHVNVPQQWSGGGGSLKKIYHTVTWQTTSRPEFFVWEVDGVEVRVSGADFETYYRLRDLASERYYVGTRGNVLNALNRQEVGNQTGDGWILLPDIERI
jgi:hypothetical protein